MPSPSSTLFPYTTLFRSPGWAWRSASGWCGGWAAGCGCRTSKGAARGSRSSSCGRREAAGSAASSLRPATPSRCRRGTSCCARDRKSTRLNSSHANISYAVTEFYTLSLHDALPISGLGLAISFGLVRGMGGRMWMQNIEGGGARLAFEQLREEGGGGERRVIFTTGDSISVQTRDQLLRSRSEEHTSELQSRQYLVCRHRVLHSFPTRRSSDLRAGPGDQLRAGAGDGRPDVDAEHRRGRRAARVRAAAGGGRRRGAPRHLYDRRLHLGADAGPAVALEIGRAHV